MAPIFGVIILLFEALQAAAEEAPSWTAPKLCASSCAAFWIVLKAEYSIIEYRWEEQMAPI